MKYLKETYEISPYPDQISPGNDQLSPLHRSNISRTPIKNLQDTDQISQGQR